MLCSPPPFSSMSIINNRLKILSCICVVPPHYSPKLYMRILSIVLRFTSINYLKYSTFFGIDKSCYI